MRDEQLTLYIQQIIQDTHISIQAKDLTKAQEVDALKTEIQAHLKRFDVAVEEIVPEMIAEEYFGGIDEATKALVDNSVDVAAGKAIGAGGVVASEFRDPVYLDSLGEILDDTFIDLRAARKTAEMSALDTIDSTIESVKADLAKGTLNGDPRKVMQEKVMTSFRDGGLTSFVTEPDKNGRRRRLPLDYYAMLVTRTKTREAGVAGAMNRYSEAGQDLVMIYENSDTCAICSRFKGLVISLTGETEGFPVLGENGISLPPYHPNCRGTISVYVLSRKTAEEIRKIKESNEKYSPTEDKRTPAQKKAYESEQKKRRIAYAEKKQFAAFNDVLGAENYKTIGAFRTGKRKNTPKFQELQSAYRSKRSAAN